jgi:hypothetical protein
MKSISALPMRACFNPAQSLKVLHNDGFAGLKKIRLPLLRLLF